MTDEALGRVWCGENLKRPEHTSGGLFYWWTHDDPELGASHGLPEPLWPACNGYSTESEAYAAVGKSLLSVWDFAERSKQEVPT